MITAVVFGFGCDLAEEDDDDDCPPVNCASWGERTTWIIAPNENSEATIGDVITVEVGARSPNGVLSLGFVALGELAGIPLQLAHETADGAGEAETSAVFQLAVPFNANISRIVLVALAEDAEGHLRADAKAIKIMPYL